MRTIRRSDRAIPLALVLLLLTIFVAACASAGTGGAAPADRGEQPAGENPQPGSGEGPGLGPVGAPAASEAPRQPDGVGAVDDAMIIRTGTMSLEVTDVPTAIRTARDAIRGMGGYIGASHTSNVDDQPFAEITYRIPVDRWEDALEALRSLNGTTKKVVSEQTEAVDVTGQVVDLEARIRNLQASETALQRIAEQATRISDILEIQNQITNVRGQIEQLEAQRNLLADQTSYATLGVTFQLPLVAAIDIQAKGWDPGATFDEASASLVAVLQAVASAGIWLLVVWIPILLLLGIIVGGVAWLLRRMGVLQRVAGSAPPVALGD